MAKTLDDTNYECIIAENPGLEMGQFPKYQDITKKIKN